MLNFEEDIVTEEISVAQLSAAALAHPVPQSVKAANEPTASGRVQAVDECEVPEGEPQVPDHGPLHRLPHDHFHLPVGR